MIINEWRASEALDMTRGRHHLTFGGELIHREMNEQNISCGTGVFRFNGAFTGDALVDFMLGDVNYTSYSVRPTKSIRGKGFSDCTARM